MRCLKISFSVTPLFGLSLSSVITSYSLISLFRSFLPYKYIVLLFFPKVKRNIQIPVKIFLRVALSRVYTYFCVQN